MRIMSLIFFVLLLAAMPGCQSPPKHPAAPQKTDTVQHNEETVYTPTALQAFMERLIDTKNIQADSAWLTEMLNDTNGMDKETYLIADSYNEPPDTVFDFPFTDVKMQFTLMPGGTQFTINGHKLPLDKDDQRYGTEITPGTIRRFHYKGSQFIIMWGRLRQSNGYGDRIQFNYFFDITGKQPVQNIYTNISPFVYYPFLYGDLNDDGRLDRLVHDGILYPFREDSLSKFEVTIKAETYLNKKWVPLRDKKNKPYYIRIETDENMYDLGKIVAKNWMREIK